MNAAAYLLDNGASGDKIALVTSEGSYTYDEIIERAHRVGGFLADSGVKRGERVALIADSSFFWVSVYLGTILAGRVSVPLPTNIEPEKLDFILEFTECGIVFAQSKYAQKYRSILETGRTLVVDDMAGIPGEVLEGAVDHTSTVNGTLPENYPAVSDFDDRSELAALMFTSGSTGVPRGVMVSHRNLIANTTGIIDYLGLNERDRMMAVLPFYYCFGTSLLHTHLRAGGSVVVDNRFLFPNVVLKRMVETECTGFAGVPSTYQILLRSSNMKKMEFPCLKHVQQAGGKLRIEFAQRTLRTVQRIALANRRVEDAGCRVGGREHPSAEVFQDGAVVQGDL